MVSIHAPARARPAQSRQSPAIDVSIHARTQARQLLGPLAQPPVSIHAPARARRDAHMPSVRPIHVQSTRPHGRDIPMVLYCVCVRFQSTRPHGARPPGLTGVFSRFQFQSTRPHGARRGQSWSWSSKSCFNPRARTGRDVHRATIAPSGYRFNPRARTGRDFVSLSAITAVWVVSIHAPARGATHHVVDLACREVVSIHAPARGATRPLMCG